MATSAHDVTKSNAIRAGRPDDKFVPTGFGFESSRSRVLFERLVEAFIDDYMKRRHSSDDSGWRGLSQLAKDLKTSPSSMYGRHGGMSLNSGSWSEGDWPSPESSEEKGVAVAR